MNRKSFVLVLVGVLMFSVFVAFAEAKDFAVRNGSDDSLFFLINGSTGNANFTGNVSSAIDFCIENGKCLSSASTSGGDIEGVLTGLTPYLLNGSSSGTVDLNFNESYLNNTIDARDDFEANTEKSGGDKYIYNDSTSILLNETELNFTIDARDTNLTGESAGGDLSGTYPDPSVVWGNGDNKLTLKEQNITNENWLEDGQSNVTFLNYSNQGNINVTSGYDVCIEGGNCLSSVSGGGGGFDGASGNYIYNNSGIVTFNSTLAGTNLSVNQSDYWNNFDTASDLNNLITLKEQNITNENWIEDSQESNLDVNSSDKWRTAEGTIDNVSDIKGSDINNDLGWINTSDLWNRSNGEVYLSDPNDQLGIGTSSPKAQLSVSGNTTFGGTWENGGAEITGGDVYAQTGYFYNITSLNVTSLNINGSQIPSKDD
ncbi:MAG: hypothetical protein ABEI74_04380, partial [Candidatus Pacearchaeota archaeon]